MRHGSISAKSRSGAWSPTSPPRSIRNFSRAPGDIVEGFLSWQTYALSDGKGVRKLDPRLAPISTALSVLGMPGLTAHFGLLDIR